MDNEKNTRTGNERAAEIELLREQTRLVEAQTQLEKVRAAGDTFRPGFCAADGARLIFPRGLPSAAGCLPGPQLYSESEKDNRS